VKFLVVFLNIRINVEELSNPSIKLAVVQSSIKDYTALPTTQRLNCR